MVVDRVQEDVMKVTFFEHQKKLQPITYNLEALPQRGDIVSFTIRLIDKQNEIHDYIVLQVFHDLDAVGHDEPTYRIRLIPRY